MNQIIEPHQFIKVGLRNNKVVSIDWKELEYYDIPREELFNIVRKFLNDAIFMLDKEKRK